MSTGPLGKVVKNIAEVVGIEGNAFATGGLTLGLLGAVAAGARYFGGFLFEVLKRNLTVSAEFDSRDESFLWIMNYLSEHPISKRTTRFSVATSAYSRLGQQINMDKTEQTISMPPVYFLPSPGTHFFMFKKRFLWLSRERTKVSGGGESPNGLERITIFSLGRSRKVLEDLALEARRIFVEKDKARTVIYSADQYGNWRRTRSRPIRPLGTIVLDHKVKAEVLDDINDFLGSEMWYSERGIPYRRGYMFFGYPGTGKTSFVTALTELMVDTPTRCILLLEDIDAAFVSRESGTGSAPTNNMQSMTHTSTTATNVTFSGLLNAIDGVAAQEGRILIMTTNHMEKLDPALIRPGRVDVKVFFDRATRHQIESLFYQFFPHDATDPPLTSEQIRHLAAQFAEHVPDRSLSMAAVQGYLMRYKGFPRRALEGWRELVEPSEVGGVRG
ncbi:hypothetical protein HDU67_006162 [Dinochytrium kinnereticum]|nr:hypothetical protein HDU67_006162 [Dinochytrium kinnereticum]